MATTEALQATLDELARPYADGRLHHCRLTAQMGDQGICQLSGAVLDKPTFATVVDQLTRAYPEMPVDTRQVRIFRPGSPLTVLTNVTDLRAQPTAKSEQVSQVLGGWSLERLDEQDGWLYIRLPEGYLGWVQKRYVGPETRPEPTHLVANPMTILRASPSHSAEVCGRVPAGTAVHIVEAEAGWSLLALPGGRSGWVAPGDLRALADLPRTEAARRRQIVVDAAQYVGVPYLWGGLTAFGIDCSGYVQLLHRLVGVEIPRDADMQMEAGLPVAESFEPGDLLFFGSGNGIRRITHVGLSLGGWSMLHSSGPRNGVYHDDVQAVPWLRDKFVGACTYLKASGAD